MKWIKKRIDYLNEARLRDILNEPQKREVKKVWGEKFLDYEEVTPTEKIKQGKWELSEEERADVINAYFSTDIKWIIENFNNLPERFVRLSMQDCLAADSYNNQKVKSAFKDEPFDMRRPTASQVVCFNEPIFIQINQSETRGDKKVARTEDGMPIMDENNRPKKIDKVPGDLILTNNKVNIVGFVQSYNLAYPNEKVNENFFSDNKFNNICNGIRNTWQFGYYDFNIFTEDSIYLLIKHNPADILNMSVSGFFRSCQTLYSGEYRNCLLMNVFDPNTIPAFFILDTPFIRKMEGTEEKVSDGIPIGRLLVRNIEDFSEDSEPKLFFDRSYPQGNQEIEKLLHNLIPKYSGNKRHEDYVRTYPFMPDVDSEDLKKMDYPYMDKLEIKPGFTIGKNTKILNLSGNYDWSVTRISPDANIKELVIETPDVPENFFKIKLKPDWIKFKKLNLKDLTPFKNIMTDSLSFYQCKVNDNFLSDLYSILPDLKKLSLASVDVKNLNEIGMFEKLEEVEFIYSLSRNINFVDVVNSIKNLKKLTISGDLIKSDSKELINQLKKSGIKVDIKGLVL
jgi:hypothetical protein